MSRAIVAKRQKEDEPNQPRRHSPDTKILYPPASDPIKVMRARLTAPRVASSRARDAFRACAMFSLFERLLKPTDHPPEQAVPPPGFVAFFWHFARQAKGLFAALFAAGLVVALLDSTFPCSWGASSR